MDNKFKDFAVVGIYRSSSDGGFSDVTFWWGYKNETERLKKSVIGTIWSDAIVEDAMKPREERTWSFDESFINDLHDYYYNEDLSWESVSDFYASALGSEFSTGVYDSPDEIYDLIREYLEEDETVILIEDYNELDDEEKKEIDEDEDIIICSLDDFASILEALDKMQWISFE